MGRKLSKIYIIGTSGSGKSFLSRKLSEKLGIQRYDLDDLYYSRKYTVERSPGKREQMLRKIASRKKWIIEGVYGSWIESALKKADLVILLDIHIARLAWRILMRHIGRMGVEKETWRDAINLVKYAHRYKHGEHSSGYKSHISLVKKHKLKYVVLKNNRQIALFLEGI